MKNDFSILQKISFLLIIICFLLASGAYFIIPEMTPKIAYVNSGTLINDYIGMKEARNQYQNKSQIWQGNIDTLKMDFQRALTQFNNDHPKLSEQERKERAQILNKMQENVKQYSKAIEEKATQEDQRITEGVLNQVNSFVKIYAEDHGYDIILGTTTSGSLLYAKDNLEITKELLNELNKSYDPSSIKTFIEEKK